MYIAVEGIPFSGKRRLITALSNQGSNSWTRQLDLDRDEMRLSLNGPDLTEYLFNHRIMDAKAYAEHPNEQFLVEMSPLTSLVYTTAYEEPDAVMNDRIARLSSVPAPYLYIYIKPDIGKCLKAAKRRKVKVEQAELERIAAAYDQAVEAGKQRFLIVEPNFKIAQVKRLLKEKLSTWQKVNQK